MFIRYVKQYSASSACLDQNACRVVEAKLKELGDLGEVTLEGVASNACYVNLTKQESEEGDLVSGGAT